MGLKLFERLASQSVPFESTDGTTKTRVRREKLCERAMSRCRRMWAKPRKHACRERIDPALAARQLEDLRQPRGHAGAGPITGEQGRRRVAYCGVQGMHKNGEQSVSRRLVRREQFCAVRSEAHAANWSKSNGFVGVTPTRQTQPEAGRIANLRRSAPTSTLSRRPHEGQAPTRGRQRT